VSNPKRPFGFSIYMKDISHMNKTNDTQKQEMERTSQKKNNFIKDSIMY